jgi:hypothetical protein
LQARGFSKDGVHPCPVGERKVSRPEPTSLQAHLGEELPFASTFRADLAILTAPAGGIRSAERQGKSDIPARILPTLVFELGVDGLLRCFGARAPGVLRLAVKPATKVGPTFFDALAGAAAAR